ncbi:hypothetical protein LCGC14_1783150 [marine sediment metagenome]|uniref:Uncharacterized protein n=1 Tax=marine sediment metagenome TaxID=412755 RepID=A0A0F9JUC3_9ZZZZ
MQTKERLDITLDKDLVHEFRKKMMKKGDISSTIAILIEKYLVSERYDDFEDILNELIAKVREGNYNCATPFVYATWFNQAIIDVVKDLFKDIGKYRVKTGCILINERAFKVLKSKYLPKSHNKGKK